MTLDLHPAVLDGLRRKHGQRHAAHQRPRAQRPAQWLDAEDGSNDVEPVLIRPNGTVQHFDVWATGSSSPASGIAAHRHRRGGHHARRSAIDSPRPGPTAAASDALGAERERSSAGLCRHRLRARGPWRDGGLRCRARRCRCLAVGLEHVVGRGAAPVEHDEPRRSHVAHRTSGSSVVFLRHRGERSEPCSTDGTKTAPRCELAAGWTGSCHEQPLHSSTASRCWRTAAQASPCIMDLNGTQLLHDPHPSGDADAGRYGGLLRTMIASCSWPMTGVLGTSARPEPRCHDPILVDLAPIAPIMAVKASANPGRRRAR